MLLVFFLITQTVSPDSILRVVDARLAQVKTIKGEIRRELSLGRAGRMETVGKFYMAMPSRLRVDLALPDEQQFVTDGKYLWVYTPEKNELVTRDISSLLPPEKHGLGALMDFGSSIAAMLAQGFDLKVDYTGRLLKYNVWIIRGKTRDTTAGVSRILIWVDRDNFLIRRFETYGKKDKLTSIYLVEKDRAFEGGIILPVQYEMRVGIKEGLMRIRNYLSLVEVNTEISDSLFRAPQMEEK